MQVEIGSVLEVFLPEDDYGLGTRTKYNGTVGEVTDMYNGEIIACRILRVPPSASVYKVGDRSTLPHEYWIPIGIIGKTKFNNKETKL